MNTLFTIGHSNRSLDDFVSLLVENNVNAIADVRSHPYSRMNPHFNRDVLEAALKQRRIAYVFLGEELGARRSEGACYENGIAKYELIARTPKFDAGLDRIREGGKTYSIALMCSEKDPLTCHRTILVSRHLGQEFSISHIIGPGSVEHHTAAELRLLKLFDMESRTLFESRDEVLAEAYARQGDKIAYQQPPAVMQTEQE